MEGLLDDEQLEGSHVARIAIGPRRIAEPVLRESWTSFATAIEFECQVWGGASTPLVPIDRDGSITPAYSTALANADVDHLQGLGGSLADVAAKHIERVVDGSVRSWGRQFAPALLRFRRQKKYARLVLPALGDDDPWQGIYAACLGALPENPDADLLRSGRLLPDLKFEDFLRVERPVVTGSLEDLLERLNPQTQALTPRLLTMNGLPQAAMRWRSLSTKPHMVLPQPTFERDLAGSLVVVICSPRSVEDHALLWNLRAGYGDLSTLPIGIPAGEDASTTLAQLLGHPIVAAEVERAARVLVTSASLSTAEIDSAVNGAPKAVHTTNYAETITFGPSAAWSREETLHWREGAAHVPPIRSEDHPKILQHRAFGRHTQMTIAVDVLSAPAPSGPGMRFESLNWHFYGGSANRWTGVEAGNSPELHWPTRLLFAKAVAARRGLEVRESEPGRAARTALVGMSSIHDLGMLAHAPLLHLLEDSASTEGIGYYRKKVREGGRASDPSRDVAVSTDSLPQISFSKFKSALGGSTAATKYWLTWAEKSGLIVRGFQLQCESCGAKQWLPLEAFALPLACRGCGQTMMTPFGDREGVQFTFRISERLRRVYRHDAMGHLLALRFFHSVLGGAGGRSSLIGSHPGLEVLQGGAVIGELDVTLLTRDGDIIPIEVKRSYGGMSDTEVGKLTAISDRLGSPWSALVVTQPGDAAPRDYIQREIRGGARGYHRLALSVDPLLDPHPFWAMGSDPFAWTPLSQDEREERERRFVDRLAQAHAEPRASWLEVEMLKSRSGA